MPIPCFASVSCRKTLRVRYLGLFGVYGLFGFVILKYVILKQVIIKRS
jgi:hypothetical protein